MADGLGVGLCKKEFNPGMFTQLSEEDWGGLD